jgi:hypothetical protein
VCKKLLAFIISDHLQDLWPSNARVSARSRKEVGWAGVGIGVGITLDLLHRLHLKGYLTARITSKSQLFDVFQWLNTL